VGAEGITGWVAEHGEPLLVPDVSLDDRFYFTKGMGDTESELAVPIKLKDRVIGVLDVQDTELNAFSQVDMSTLQTVAGQTAIAIENARLYDANRRYTEELRELVAEHTADLKAANERLLTLAQVKDEFVSNVSHELRTPIASLKLYHSLLARYPAKAETYLATLRRETDRLEHIIDGLLQLSRVDQGQVAITLCPVNLNDLVRLEVSDRPLMAESRGLTLTLKEQPDAPVIKADPMLLGQVLSILLTNSLNYTPAGGWVEVSTQVCKSKGDLWAGFTVSDNGQGIPPDEQPHIFERFFRGKAGRKSGIPGTGLGLALVKEIVEQHQGRVEVASEGVPGKGSAFSVWLPVDEKAPNHF
jgi:signal transduction histidine kinase